MSTPAARIRSRALDAVIPSVIGPTSHNTATPVAARQFRFSTAPCTLSSSSQTKPNNSSNSNNLEREQQKRQGAASDHRNNEPTPTPSHKKTVAELDEEMMKKMSGIAGDGGSAGIEYEDGQPVSMKRSVKNNMFRYI
ncbi:uncharacterized protein PG998_003763 [Apiospora kogelbergensis]|uniref:Uncharacterized protein n=1 Tax=Apiospora kogelbergensis TaxID=1337665 RepID=A0AAW0QUY0_9PEZI